MSINDNMQANPAGYRITAAILEWSLVRYVIGRMLKSGQANANVRLNKFQVMKKVLKQVSKL